MFGCQLNRGYLDKIMRIVDVESPLLTVLVPLVVLRIGTELLGDLVFEVKVNKEVKKK